MASSPGQCNNSSSTAGNTAVVQLPADVVCTFVGEGSANTVFAIQAPQGLTELDFASASESEPEPKSTASEPKTQGPQIALRHVTTTITTHYLLRIPKAGPGVGPAICRDNHAYYTDIMQPLLGPDRLVGQHLAAGVVRTGLVHALNAILAARDRNGCRRRDWVGGRIAADVDVALLVEDMGTSSSPTSITIQFKPKWLTQSPNAPAGARRCRTCALSAAAAAAGKTHKIKPCPMVLLVAAGSGAGNVDPAPLDDALWAYLWQHLGDDVSPATRAFLASTARPALVRWLRTTDLFRRLAAVQREYDPHGVLAVVDGDRRLSSSSPETVQALQTAMTVRDCSCYLRLQWNEDRGKQGTAAAAAAAQSASAAASPVTITAKLGDLDRKEGAHKIERWASQERALLAGGFYAASKNDPAPTGCWLKHATAGSAAKTSNG